MRDKERHSEDFAMCPNVNCKRTSRSQKECGDRKCKFRKVPHRHCGCGEICLIQ